MFNNPDFEDGGAGVSPPGWTVTSNLNDGVGVTGTANNPPTSFAALNLAAGGTKLTETVRRPRAARGPSTDPDVPPLKYPFFGHSARHG